jgi:hypothetical protein
MLGIGRALIPAATGLASEPTEAIIICIQI